MTSVRTRQAARSVPGWLTVIGNVAITLVCVFFALVVVGTVGSSALATNPAIAILNGFGFTLTLVLSIALIWRSRWPYRMAVASAAVAILLPSTPLPALIAMTTLVHRKSGRWVWLLVGATYLGAVISVLWDTSGGTSFYGVFGGGAGTGSERLLSGAAEIRKHLLWAAPLIGAMLTIPFVALGLILRARSERDDAVRLSSAAGDTVVALNTEVSRDRERQAVARELHDTMASRLSAVSLNAGTLELILADSDAKAAAMARVVRESAQHSLDDLRHVVDVLRNPAAHNAITAQSTLHDIARLVDDAHSSGDRVRSQIMISDPLGCEPTVAHACFRIVQESLSNARRHSPGADVLVDLRGGPATGISVSISNQIVSIPGTAIEPRRSVGGGHGVVGMTERAKLVGGSLSAGPEPDGGYVVRAWLPWVSPVFS